MPYKYFTIWVFILILFHYITSYIFSLPFLSFIVLINGLYLSYINPAKYYIEYKDTIIILDGYKKNIADICLHIIPFAFIYFTYGFENFFTNWKLIPSLLLILIYLVIYNPSFIYHIHINEIIIISIISVFLYYLLTKI